MPLASGTRLGSYEIVVLLGAGGMGEVYRARDTKLDRDIALKILPDAFARDADRLARFERASIPQAPSRWAIVGGSSTCPRTTPAVFTSLTSRRTVSGFCSSAPIPPLVPPAWTSSSIGSTS
ncbi:MAG TPA: hypothetical protein VES67_14940 [Vicinamibacterales bacterium]|nr:hypothetical protein [Vicinamibacterales bacterium]